MIDFLLTPIGIWTGAMALIGAAFLIGAALSMMNSLWGEGLALYSAAAAGVVGLLGILPALYFSGAGDILTVILAIYAIVIALLGLFALVMAGAGSSRGY